MINFALKAYMERAEARDAIARIKHGKAYREWDKAVGRRNFILNLFDLSPKEYKAFLKRAKKAKK